MKSIRIVVFFAAAAFAACSNLPPDDSAPFKAYPNPYNPTAGVLTIEKTSGAAYTATDTNELVVLDYNLGEVYHASVTPGTVAPNNGKITWAGIDSAGSKVVPGVYYVKVIVSKSTGVEGADAMFKLVVQ